MSRVEKKYIVHFDMKNAVNAVRINARAGALIATPTKVPLRVQVLVGDNAGDGAIWADYMMHDKPITLSDKTTYVQMLHQGVYRIHPDDIAANEDVKSPVVVWYEDDLSLRVDQVSYTPVSPGAAAAEPAPTPEPARGLAWNGKHIVSATGQFNASDIDNGAYERPGELCVYFTDNKDGELPLLDLPVTLVNAAGDDILFLGIHMHVFLAPATNMEMSVVDAITHLKYVVGKPGWGFDLCLADVGGHRAWVVVNTAQFA